MTSTRKPRLSAVAVVMGPMLATVTAPRAGRVSEIRVKETDIVKEGQVLVVLE